MKPLLVTSGEPAGIGPDICLALAKEELPIVVMADKKMLEERAALLKLKVSLLEYHRDTPFQVQNNALWVYSTPCKVPVTAGVPSPSNAASVIHMLTAAVNACLQGEFSALVTAPVHKAIINEAGIAFSGHTEFLANLCGVKTVVMMLACAAMKVALMTTHLPLSSVPATITTPLCIEVITELDKALRKDFGISRPNIHVAGLNPHAGEGGYLGREELDSIIPALEYLQKQKILVEGPFPADTLFTGSHLQEADALVAMYHDQGLPVLKYAGFGEAVNITLGLPIIRTSVDHGTAFALAGSGQAKSSSLLFAIKQAQRMVQMRANYAKN